MRLVNNTLMNAGRGWGGGLRLENPEAKNVVVRNNIYYKCSTDPVQVWREPASWNFDHNLFTVKAGARGGRRHR